MKTLIVTTLLLAAFSFGKVWSTGANVATLTDPRPMPNPDIGGFKIKLVNNTNYNLSFVYNTAVEGQKMSGETENQRSVNKKSTYLGHANPRANNHYAGFDGAYMKIRRSDGHSFTFHFDTKSRDWEVDENFDRITKRHQNKKYNIWTEWINAESSEYRYWVVTITPL